jgi:hypothetical protein
MAYQFTAASSQYLSTAASPASGSPMTIACWARRTYTTENPVCVAVGQASGAHRNQVQIGINNNIGGPPFAVILFCAGSLITNQVATTSTATTQNVWHHAVGVFASSTSRTAFIDGVAGSEGTTNIGTQNAATYINVGVRTANNSLAGFFTGDIAEVGIWNVALTADEIASLAKGMTCDKVRPQNLVFYAPLVRDLIDAKGGLTITNNNSATVADHPRVYA